VHELKLDGWRICAMAPFDLHAVGARERFPRMAADLGRFQATKLIIDDERSALLRFGSGRYPDTPPMAG
jgi:hypothetical protein